MLADLFIRLSHLVSTLNLRSTISTLFSRHIASGRDPGHGAPGFYFCPGNKTVYAQPYRLPFIQRVIPAESNSSALFLHLTLKNFLQLAHGFPASNAGYLQSITHADRRLTHATFALIKTPKDAAARHCAR